jgi:hypothetical protein
MHISWYDFTLSNPYTGITDMPNVSFTHENGGSLDIPSMQYTSAQSCPVKPDQLQPLSFGVPVPAYRTDKSSITLPRKIVQIVIIMPNICSHVSYGVR